MENKDRLDEFLQRKFAEDKPEQRIAFREEHWLQAQALIEADERRRRRGFWWWWLGGGLVLLLAAWFYFAEGWKTAPTAMTTTELKTGAQPKGVLETPVLPSNPDSESGANSGANAIASKTNFAQQTNKNTQPKSAAKNKFSSKNPIAQANPNGTNAAVKKNTDAATRKNLETLKTQTRENASAPGSHQTPEVPSEPQSAVPKLVLAAFGQLPLPLEPLTRPLPSLEPLPLSPPPATAPERLRNWRWQLGIVAAGGSALGHLENEKTGFGAGLSARLHRRGKPYSFNADILWRFRPGGISDSTLGTVEQLKYSFGYTLDRIEQRVVGTHWLELPLYFQYHLNVVNLEGGLMPSVLLAIQGREAHTLQSSLSPDPSVLEHKRITLENRYFTKLHVGAFAGLEWQPTRQLHIGFRLHYQPGQITMGSDAAVPGRSPVWADLRVRCLFGK